MKAGKLDRRITIRRATAGDDGFGQTQTWSDVGKIWASATPVSDSERIRAASISAEITMRFQVRWSSITRDITPKDRIDYDGRTFDIFAVKEIGRREGIEITAAAGAD